MKILVVDYGAMGLRNSRLLSKMVENIEVLCVDTK